MDHDPKEAVKAWLKRHGRDRDWLAAQLNTAVQTIHNWLSVSSSRTIPAAKLALIERLMQDDAAAEAARKQQLDPVAQVFSVEVSLPQFRRYSQAALKAQQTLEDWAIEELDRAAEEYFTKQQTAEAEEPTEETATKKPTAA
jgi:hypothetical protein